MRTEARVGVEKGSKGGSRPPLQREIVKEASENDPGRSEGVPRQRGGIKVGNMMGVVSQLVVCSVYVRV